MKMKDVLIGENFTDGRRVYQKIQEMVIDRPLQNWTAIFNCITISNIEETRRDQYCPPKTEILFICPESEVTRL